MRLFRMAWAAGYRIEDDNHGGSVSPYLTTDSSVTASWRPIVQARRSARESAKYDENR